MTPLFSIHDSFSFAWNKMKENFWFLILIMFAFVVISGTLDEVGGRDASRIIFDIANILVGFFITFTFTRIGLKALKNNIFTWDDLFKIDGTIFLQYLLGIIVFTFASLVGFVFLIIPGIIVLVRGSFFVFALIENNLTFVDAFKKSIALTRGHFWQLFGFMTILFLINVAGVLLVGIGLLFTIPFCFLATAYVYHRLSAPI